VIAPDPTSWLRFRLQGNGLCGLCQADEVFDAEQVGQHHRLLCQELVNVSMGSGKEIVIDYS